MFIVQYTHVTISCPGRYFSYEGGLSKSYSG